MLAPATTPPERVPTPRPDQPPVEDDWTGAQHLRERLAPLAAGNPELMALVDVGVRLAANSKAAQTRAAYLHHYKVFERFCSSMSIDSGPPASAEAVMYFIGWLETVGRTDPGTRERTGEPLSHGYVRQAVAAIRHRHVVAGLSDPTADPDVAAVMRGYGNTHGTGSRGKDALRRNHVLAMLGDIQRPRPSSTRDHAICMLATDPAIHVSANALAGLTGERVLLPDSPADPMILLVPGRSSRTLTPVEVAPLAQTEICPVGAMRALRADAFGPVFRSSPDRGLSRTGLVAAVTRAVEEAGVAPAASGNGLPKLDVEQRRALAASLLEPSPAQLRDAALVSNLYWGCFRASELLLRDWRHVQIVAEGIEWTLPFSKADQQGQDGAIVGVPRLDDPWECPVLALARWRDSYEQLVGRPVRDTDPVFITLDRRTVGARMKVPAANAMVKLRARSIGLDGNYGSHSLRSGFTNDALDSGIPEAQVQQHGRWRNAKSLDSYRRRSGVWARTNAALRLRDSGPGPLD